MGNMYIAAPLSPLIQQVCWLICLRNCKISVPEQDKWRETCYNTSVLENDLLVFQSICTGKKFDKSEFSKGA